MRSAAINNWSFIIYRWRQSWLFQPMRVKEIEHLWRHLSEDLIKCFKRCSSSRFSISIIFIDSCIQYITNDQWEPFNCLINFVQNWKAKIIQATCSMCWSIQYKVDDVRPKWPLVFIYGYNTLVRLLSRPISKPPIFGPSTSAPFRG